MSRRSSSAKRRSSAGSAGVKAPSAPLAPAPKKAPAGRRARRRESDSSLPDEPTLPKKMEGGIPVNPAKAGDRARRSRRQPAPPPTSAGRAGGEKPAKAGPSGLGGSRALPAAPPPSSSGPTSPKPPTPSEKKGRAISASRRLTTGRGSSRSRSGSRGKRSSMAAAAVFEKLTTPAPPMTWDYTPPRQGRVNMDKKSSKWTWSKKGEDCIVFEIGGAYVRAGWTSSKKPGITHMAVVGKIPYDGVWRLSRGNPPPTVLVGNEILTAPRGALMRRRFPILADSLRSVSDMYLVLERCLTAMAPYWIKKGGPRVACVVPDGMLESDRRVIASFFLEDFTNKDAIIMSSSFATRGRHPSKDTLTLCCGDSITWVLGPDPSCGMIQTRLSGRHVTEKLSELLVDELGPIWGTNPKQVKAVKEGKTSHLFKKGEDNPKRLTELRRQALKPLTDMIARMIERALGDLGKDHKVRHVLCYGGTSLMEGFTDILSDKTGLKFKLAPHTKDAIWINAAHMVNKGDLPFGDLARFKADNVYPYVVG